VGDQAGTLGSISEEINNRNVETTEGTQGSVESGEKAGKVSPVLVDLDNEVELKESEGLTNQKNTTSEMEVVDLFSEEETASTPVTDSNVTVTDGNIRSTLIASEDTEIKASEETGETVPEEVKGTVSEVIKETVSEEVKETISEAITETVPEEIKEAVSNEVEQDPVSKVIPPMKEETDESQAIEVDPTSKNTDRLKSEKVQSVLNRIREFNNLPENTKKALPNEQKPKKKKNKASNKKKATVSVQENSVKLPLPCGADVMKSIPRGKSVSGREWKDPKSNPRYLYKDKGLKMPLAKQLQLKAERMQVRELENRMKEEERARRADLAARRELNKKRTEENARKSQVVQVIRNTNKIKRMNKKQLKLIQKRDTSD